jgi:four helix bundle suffix protein
MQEKGTAKNTDRHGRARTGDGGSLIPKHGGYKNTKTWQLADLIYDVTVRFCDKYVDRRSRTHDQMVQSARSGCQNLQEGSVDSATSKKIELKLTGIAKGSLKELERDFQKFLQHRDLPEWPPNHPALMRFKALQCATLEEFRAWVATEVKRAGTYPEEYGLIAPGDADRKNTDRHGRTQTKERPVHRDIRVGPCKSVSVRVSPKDLPAVLAANAALSLLNLCIHLIGRQMDAQADAFEKEGGFTERLYRVRSERRRQGSD